MSRGACRSRYGARPAAGARPAPIALLSSGIHPPLVRVSVHNQRPLSIIYGGASPAAAPGDLLLVLERRDLDVRFTSSSSSLDKVLVMPPNGGLVVAALLLP
jgi:hypothetical protein